MRTNFFLLTLSLFALVLIFGCEGRTDVSKEPGADEEPVLLEYGSTDGDAIVTDTGEVIFTDTRTTLGEIDESHNPDFPPVFPAAQRVFPAEENPSERENYITRAPFDAVEIYYTNFMKFGIAEPDDPDELESDMYVQTFNMADEEGRKSTAMYLNNGDGPRGGLKVMIKEFPAQQGVQIVLTTLAAVPIGLNPFGYYLSPEEMDEMFEQMEAEEAERARIQAEMEALAVDPERSDEDTESGDSDDEGEEGE